MNTYTEKEASNQGCPMVRGKPNCLCMASRCMAWRWAPQDIVVPGYASAVAAAVGITPKGHGKPLTAPDAAEWVSANLEALGLSNGPHGYCGMAGGVK